MVMKGWSGDALANLSKEEWRHILYALKFASSKPGFRFDYNPLPWVLEFEAVVAKIEAAVGNNGGS